MKIKFGDSDLHGSTLSAKKSEILSFLAVKVNP